jgi:isopenicillin-N epimerase
VLTGQWGTTLETPSDLIGAMVTVPLPAEAGETTDDATRLWLALLVDDRIEAPIHASRGRLWVRVSAQVYNDSADVVRLAEAVQRRVLRSAVRV